MPKVNEPTEVMTKRLRLTKWPNSLKQSTMDLLELSKSGIIYLVLFTVVLGFFISQDPSQPISFANLFLVAIGLSLVGSGSAALNQVQEIKQDRLMDRTKDRPLASSRMSMTTAKVFVGLTIILGMMMLAFTGILSIFILGALAVFSYNVLYTMWWKPTFGFAAIPGAIPGALPALMGSVAATGNVLDPKGWYLFMILFFWQLPHFWSLAIKYAEDYQRGGFPTLPVVIGNHRTTLQIAIWTLGYCGLLVIAPMFLQVGTASVFIALVISAWVIRSVIQFTKSIEPEKAWIRVFLVVNFSLIFAFIGFAGDHWSYKLLQSFMIDS